MTGWNWTCRSPSGRKQAEPRFARPIGRPNSSANQRDHLRGEALQALDAVGNRAAPEVEDQFVHADRGKRTDVAGDLVGGAGEDAAGAVAIGNAGVVQRG